MSAGAYSAIILAGGDGTRLRAFTRGLVVDDRPKQFCPVGKGLVLSQRCDVADATCSCRRRS